MGCMFSIIASRAIVGFIGAIRKLVKERVVGGLARGIRYRLLGISSGPVVVNVYAGDDPTIDQLTWHQCP